VTIRIIYFKQIPLERTQPPFFHEFSKFKDDNSDNLDSRIMNLVDYDACDDKNIYLNFGEDTLINKTVI
jgi:hypothetical protein